jgi:hypothetical protein
MIVRLGEYYDDVYSNLYSNGWLTMMNGREIFDIIPPHLFFTRQEIAIWVNMAVWDSSEDIELPGPAEWWTEDYDYVKYGFDIPLVDNGQSEAFAMLFEDEEPIRYNLIFPSDVSLRLMEDSAEARLIQQMML